MPTGNLLLVTWYSLRRMPLRPLHAVLHLASLVPASRSPDLLCCHILPHADPSREKTQVVSTYVHVSQSRTRMASSGSKRGQRKTGGSIPLSGQHAGAGVRSAFSRGQSHQPPSSSSNFHGFGGSVADVGFATFSPALGGGGGGWVPGM